MSLKILSQCTIFDSSSRIKTFSQFILSVVYTPTDNKLGIKWVYNNFIKLLI